MLSGRGEPAGIHLCVVVCPAAAAAIGTGAASATVSKMAVSSLVWAGASGATYTAVSVPTGTFTYQGLAEATLVGAIAGALGPVVGPGTAAARLPSFFRYLTFAGIGAGSQLSGESITDLAFQGRVSIGWEKVIAAGFLSGFVAGPREGSSLGNIFARQFLHLSARGTNMISRFSTLTSPSSSPAARFLWASWAFEATVVTAGVFLVDEID